MTPAYLRKIDTGECFAYSPWLAERKDMTPWQGPLPWEKVEAPVVKKAAIVIPDPPADDKKIEDEKKVSEKEVTADTATCTVCGKVCKNALGLAAHMRTHK